MLAFLIFPIQVSWVEPVLAQIVKLSQVGSFSGILELGFLNANYILRQRDHKIVVSCYFPRRLGIRKNQTCRERQISQVLSRLKLAKVWRRWRRKERKLQEWEFCPLIKDVACDYRFCFAILPLTVVSGYSSIVLFAGASTSLWLPTLPASLFTFYFQLSLSVIDSEVFKLLHSPSSLNQHFVSGYLVSSRHGAKQQVLLAFIWEWH